MPLALSSARCLLSLAGGLALAAAACFAGWRLLAGDTTDIGNAVGRKSIGVTTNLLQSMAPDCAAEVTESLLLQGKYRNRQYELRTNDRNACTASVARHLRKEPTKAKCSASRRQSVQPLLCGSMEFSASQVISAGQVWSFRGGQPNQVHFISARSAC